MSQGRLLKNLQNVYIIVLAVSTLIILMRFVFLYCDLEVFKKFIVALQ